MRLWRVLRVVRICVAIASGIALVLVITTLRSIHLGIWMGWLVISLALLCILSTGSTLGCFSGGCKRPMERFLLAITIGFTVFCVVYVVSAQGTSKVETIKVSSDLLAFADKLREYRKLHGEYPAVLEAIADRDFAGRPCPLPTDPWDNPYLYRMPGHEWKDAFDIWSTGPNGENEHGQGDDIPSWRVLTVVLQDGRPSFMPR